MEYKQQVLIELLNAEGWDLDERYDSDLDWWVDEVWAVKSRWHPTDFRIYFTFLVDPQHEGNRPKGEGVWALGVSLAKPMVGERLEYEATLPLNPKFERRLESFKNEINELRDRAT